MDSNVHIPVPVPAAGLFESSWSDIEKARKLGGTVYTIDQEGNQVRTTFPADGAAVQIVEHRPNDVAALHRRMQEWQMLAGLHGEEVSATAQTMRTLISKVE